MHQFGQIHSGTTDAIISQEVVQDIGKDSYFSFPTSVSTVTVFGPGIAL